MEQEIFVHVVSIRIIVSLLHQYAKIIKMSTCQESYRPTSILQISSNYDKNLNFEKFFCSYTEAVVRRCSVKQVFFEISQNSQEKTCAIVSFLIKLQALKWRGDFL